MSEQRRIWAVAGRNHVIFKDSEGGNTWTEPQSQFTMHQEASGRLVHQEIDYGSPTLVNSHYSGLLDQAYESGGRERLAEFLKSINISMLYQVRVPGL